MFNRVRAISFVILGLSLCSSALGGMMPEDSLNKGNVVCAPAKGLDGHLSQKEFASSEFLSFSDLDSHVIDLTANSIEENQETSAELDLYPWSNGPGSLDLCLYALAGLGFVKTAPKVKQFSTSVLPDWYHEGAPLQIRNAYALDLDSLAVPSFCCFIQPDIEPDQLNLANQQSAIATLIEKSQITGGVFSSRGPPHSS